MLTRRTFRDANGEISLTIYPGEGVRDAIEDALAELALYEESEERGLLAWITKGLPIRDAADEVGEDDNWVSDDAEEDDKGVDDLG